MRLKFTKHQGDPNDFFKLLPSSWSEGLLPLWQDYALKSEIFTLVDHGEIVAGGILVKGIPEDMHLFLQESMQWASKGYRYIGYLWVVETRRNQHLGSKWLQELARYYPKMHFWLTIEEEPLKDFYLRNGFRMVRELQNGEAHEWLLVWDEPNK
tara:strand:- start:111 stop:572 length:462 start_codon:yes stop_codon:yes gene_type:complete